MIDVRDTALLYLQFLESECRQLPIAPVLRLDLFFREVLFVRGFECEV